MSTPQCIHTISQEQPIDLSFLYEAGPEEIRALSLRKKVQYAARDCGKLIDAKNPLKGAQDFADSCFESYIKPCFPSRINHILDRTDGTTLKTQAAFYTIKFIPRVLRSILELTYLIMSSPVQFCVHPLETLASLTLFLEKILIALKNPKLYTSAGAGFLGAAVGQGIVSPHGITGCAIGFCLIAFGLIAGTLKSLVESEEGRSLEAWQKQMWDQIAEIPEMFAIGLIIGLMIGAVENAKLVEEGNPLGQVLGLADDIQPLASSSSSH